MNEKICDELLRLSYKAFIRKEVPVACIIVKNGKIISKAHNLKEKNKNPFDHAEILAIKKACKKNRDWRLDDCIMYVTLKPCSMCYEVIKNARIKEVYYIIEPLNNITTKENIKIVKLNYNEKKFSDILTGFFKEKR